MKKFKKNEKDVDYYKKDDIIFICETERNRAKPSETERNRAKPSETKESKWIYIARNAYCDWTFGYYYDSSCA